MVWLDKLALRAPNSLRISRWGAMPVMVAELIKTLVIYRSKRRWPCEPSCRASASAGTIFIVWSFERPMSFLSSCLFGTGAKACSAAGLAASLAKL